MKTVREIVILHLQITTTRTYSGLIRNHETRRQWSYVFMKESSSWRRGMEIGEILDSHTQQSTTKMLKIQANIRYIFYLFLIILKANWQFKAKTVKMYYICFIIYVKIKCKTTKYNL